MCSKLAKFCMNDVFENTCMSKYRNDFYPHEESHEGLGATVLQSQTYAKVLRI